MDAGRLSSAFRVPAANKGASNTAIASLTWSLNEAERLSVDTDFFLLPFLGVLDAMALPPSTNEFLQPTPKQANLINTAKAISNTSARPGRELFFISPASSLIPLMATDTALSVASSSDALVASKAVSAARFVTRVSLVDLQSGVLNSVEMAVPMMEQIEVTCRRTPLISAPANKELIACVPVLASNDGDPCYVESSIEKWEYTQNIS